MKKAEYLSELENELKGLSDADRANALAYYGEYLDDAESAGLSDAGSILGSPHTLAAQIKADIAMSPLIGGLSSSAPDIPYSVSPDTPGSAYAEYSQTSPQQSYGQAASDTAHSASFTPPPPGQQWTSGQQQTPGYQQTPPAKPKKTGIGVIWTVVLAILAIPVGLPLAIGLCAVIFALLVALFALLFSLAAVVLALFVSGILAGIVGFFFLFSNFPIGLFYLGSGAVLIGVSLLFGYGFWQLQRLCIKGVARLFNAIRVKLTKKERVAQ